MSNNWNWDFFTFPELGAAMQLWLSSRSQFFFLSAKTPGHGMKWCTGSFRFFTDGNNMISVYLPTMPNLSSSFRASIVGDWRMSRIDPPLCCHFKSFICDRVGLYWASAHSSIKHESSSCADRRVHSVASGAVMNWNPRSLYFSIASSALFRILCGTFQLYALFWIASL